MHRPRTAPVARLRQARRRGGRVDLLFMNLYYRNAGWSSLVARWAHNPKVGGSNPPPATKGIIRLRAIVQV